VIIRRGGALGVGAAGEITNVTQVFQPSGRFSAANSLLPRAHYAGSALRHGQLRIFADFERYATTIAAFIRLAMIRIMLRRLAANASP
jgi:hypothetical protein